MSEFWVDEAGLDDMARAVERIGGRVQDARTAHGAAGGHDVALVHETHLALVERWRGGLLTATDALVEVAGTISACAADYRAGDDDTSVVFAGITS